MHGDRKIVAGIGIDDIEARRLRSFGGIDIPAPDRLDIRQIHLPRLQRMKFVDRPVRWRQGNLAAVVVWGRGPCIGGLESGQTTVFVDLLRHAGEERNVTVVPQAALDDRAVLRAVVDLHLLRADNRPAALGLDAAHLSHAGGIGVTHAVAMRDLVEAVLRGQWADLHRLEENIVTHIAGHRKGTLAGK